MEPIFQHFKLTDINGCQTTYNLDTVQAGLDINFFWQVHLWMCCIGSRFY